MDLIKAFYYSQNNAKFKGLSYIEFIEIPRYRNLLKVPLFFPGYIVCGTFITGNLAVLLIKNGGKNDDIMQDTEAEF